MIKLHRFRCGNATPCFCRRFQNSQCQHLYRGISVHGSFYRSGCHQPLTIIRCQLTEQTVLDTAAHDVDHRIGFTGASMKVWH